MRFGPPETFPRLLADIGGTHARFALQTAQGIGAARVLSCADYPTVADALRHVLAGWGAPTVRYAALAVATAVDGDRVRLTNHTWEFSRDALRRDFGWTLLYVLNDFTALALALPTLPPDGLRQIGGQTAVPSAPAGVLGPGTGLGVSALIPVPGGAAVPLAGEGGHVSFSPADGQEVALWEFAHARHGHVSAERLLSGAGLQLLHEWLGAPPSPALSPADITTRALQGTDARCVQAVERFCLLLGTVAANLALTLGARGGIYLGGGIVPRLGALFARSGFRRRFEDKGRFSAYLARIPVFVIDQPHAALGGVAAALQHAIDTSRSP